MERNLKESKETTLEWLRKTHFTGSAEAGISCIWMYTDVKFPGYPIDKKAYMELYTEKGIERLKEAGVNGVCGYLADFGYPPKKNREVFDTCVKFTNLCRQAGMKTIVYLQPMNIVWKPYYEEMPESRTWEAISKDGGPVPYGSFTGRHMICLNNVSWHKYLKKIIVDTLNRVDPDGLFFDNFWAVNCFCSICRKRFGERISRKPEAELRKLGIEHKTVNPPQKEDFKDPLYREWVDFCHHNLINFTQLLRDIINEVKPGVPFTTNCDGQGYAVYRRHDLAQVSKLKDFVFIETDTAPRIQEYNLVNSIRSLKYARACTDKPILCYAHVPGSVTPRESIPTPEQIKLGIAEAAVCGASGTFDITERFTDRWTILTADEFKLQRDAAREYYQFLDENWDYYEEVESTANVAVFHSKYIEWTWKKTFPHVFGFEQALMQTQTPFDIIVDDNFTAQTLAKYDVLVIPNLLILPDKQIKTIIEFVARGGGLVVTGHSGIYNEHYELRRDYGLKEILGVSYPHILEIWREYKKGRVVFLPDGPDRIDIFGGAGSSESNESGEGDGAVGIDDNILIDIYQTGGYEKGMKQVTMLPEQYRKLKEAVQWASKDNLPLEVEGDHKYICTELTVQPDQNRLLVHLLNYDFLEPVRNLNLYVRIPHGKALKRSFLISPEAEGTCQLDPRTNQGKAEFTIPNLKMYNLLVIELK